MYKKMNKSELIDFIINEYGYNRDDLKEEDGRLFTNPKLKAIIEKENLDEEAFSNIEENKSAFRKEFKDDDLIEVMNGLSGAVVYESKRTGRIWRLRDFGIVDKIPYSEILNIYNNSHRMLEEGWLIILEKQIVEDFNLTEIYKNILTPKNIDEIFKKDLDELEVILKGLPEGSRQAFFNKARDSYNKGKLDSVKLISLIEREFNTSLKDNMPIEKDS